MLSIIYNNNLQSLQFIQKMSKQKSHGESTKSSQYFSSTPHQTRQLSFKEDTENPQLIFLRSKNKQSQELMLRMSQQLTELYKTNHTLTKLNSKYIETLNSQYRNNFKAFLSIGRMNKNKQQKSKGVLVQFQKDYRNLIKHCFSLQEQIKVNNRDLNLFSKMKEELIMTNHTSISELVSEFLETTQELINLKKNNNKTQFQIQKCQEQLKKIQAKKNLSKISAGQANQQLQIYKSLINTIQNESLDKENSYKSQIYTLELKVQKLQSQMRGLQQGSRNKHEHKSRQKMKEIQFQTRNKQPLNYTSELRINRSNSAMKIRRSICK